MRYIVKHLFAKLRKALNRVRIKRRYLQSLQYAFIASCCCEFTNVNVVFTPVFSPCIAVNLFKNAFRCLVTQCNKANVFTGISELCNIEPLRSIHTFVIDRDIPLLIGPIKETLVRLCFQYRKANTRRDVTRTRESAA